MTYFKQQREEIEKEIELKRRDRLLLRKEGKSGQNLCYNNLEDIEEAKLQQLNKDEDAVRKAILEEFKDYSVSKELMLKKLGLNSKEKKA